MVNKLVPDESRAQLKNQTINVVALITQTRQKGGEMIEVMRTGSECQ